MTSRPGYGDRVTLTSSTSGTKWTGVVLVWGSIGTPFVSLDYTAERRWFPASWVTKVTPGPGPAPCTCPPADADADPEALTPITADCDEHGDPATLLRKARA